MINARMTDPSTSHEAAGSTEQRTRMMDLLLTAFDEAGSEGLTAEEAGTKAGLLDTGYWKRVSDLHTDGMLREVNGVVRRGTSGRAQRVLRITVFGRARLHSLKAMMAQAA